MIRTQSAVFTCAALAGALVVTGSIRAMAQERGAAHSDFSGRWQLNPTLSEDATAKLRSAPPPQRGGHGPWRHIGRGNDDAHIEVAHERFLNAPVMFVLATSGERIVLTDSAGRTRTFIANGKRVKVDGQDVHTQWHGQRLVSITSLGKVRVVETYERAPAASRLIVTTLIEMRGYSVSVRRVYDAISDMEAGSDVWLLGDATVLPRAHPVQEEARSFWSTKRVLLAVVVVKLVIIGAMLFD